MEVKLDRRYPVEASIDQAWAVLSDIRLVAGCMPGAQITEQVDDTHYKGTVKTKIGPASMQFNGDIEVLGLDTAARSLQMLGKGADRGGSSASMRLAAVVEAGESPGTSVLVGTATVTVSGKLAQFGSRLLVPVSDAMLAQFADHFRTAAAAAAPPGSAAQPEPEPPAQGESGAASGAVAAQAVTAVPAAAHAAPAHDAGPASPQTAAFPPGGPAAGRDGSALPPTRAAAAPPPTELNALALMWTVFKGWLAGLFGRR